MVPDDPKERDKGDLFINARARWARRLHEDTVIARVTGVRERGREGRVEAVLRQANQTAIGTFVKLKSQSTLFHRSTNGFIYEIGIAPADTLGANDGDIVNVEITQAS